MEEGRELGREMWKEGSTTLALAGSVCKSAAGEIPSLHLEKETFQSYPEGEMEEWLEVMVVVR